MIFKNFTNIQKRAAVFLLITAASLLILFFINPAEISYYPPCYFRLITGKLCPACGGMRGMHELLYGNISSALDYNFLLIIFVPVIAYLIIYNIGALVNKPVPAIPASKTILIISSIILIAFWILRNLAV